MNVNVLCVSLICSLILLANLSSFCYFYCSVYHSVVLVSCFNYSSYLHLFKLSPWFFLNIKCAIF